MTSTQGHDTPLSHGQHLCEIFSRSKMASRSYGPDTYFGCVLCELGPGDITLGQGHGTVLGHGQYLFELLFRSNIAVRSFGPDPDFGYACTLSFEV